MPKSMTGYGRGESVQSTRKIRVELKAVNHRFSDFTIKLPRFLNPFEDKVRKRLAECISRGKVDIYIQFESFAEKDASVNVNIALADSYIEAISGLSNRYDFGRIEASVAMEFLIKHPEVLTLSKFESTATSEEEHEEIWATLSEALDSALVQFNQMRDIEGQAMADDIESNRLQAIGIVSEIAEVAPEVLRLQAQKLRERLEDAIAKLDRRPDDVRLVTEMALIADKGCISEEISRLKSHFDQMLAILQGNEAIGRKLDFLVQELNREVNTIGSKSNDVTVTTLVVELKSLIEKMREQAQNLE